MNRLAEFIGEPLLTDIGHQTLSGVFCEDTLVIFLFFFLFFFYNKKGEKNINKMNK